MEGDAENKTSVIIGSVADNIENSDALKECIKLDKNFSARVQMLYNSTRDGRPLLKSVVRQISREGDISILELKKEAIRLSFFIDRDFDFRGILMKKAIVFLSYFPKHDNKATGREVKKAQKIRDSFLIDKKNDLLKIEVYYG